jgi:hypothetical protein
MFTGPSPQPYFHDMNNIFIKKNAGEEPYIVIVGTISNTPSISGFLSSNDTSLVSGFLSSNGASLVGTDYNYYSTGFYHNYNYKRHHVSNELCFSVSITDPFFGHYKFGTLLEGTMQYRGNIISPGEGTKF